MFNFAYRLLNTISTVAAAAERVYKRSRPPRTTTVSLYQRQLTLGAQLGAQNSEVDQKIKYSAFTQEPTALACGISV